MATPYPPIAAYALLSDSHSAALVSSEGSIDWCCFERFDARPVFARILDWSRGGHFQICPTTAYRSRRRYLPGTNIVETRFESDAGVLVLTDCLAVREFETRDAVEPYRQLIRLVHCVAGEVPIRVDFEPRFDYGLTTPQMRPLDDHLATVFGGADALVVQSDLGVHRAGLSSSEGERTLRAGERAYALLTYAKPHQLRAESLELARIDHRVQATERFWVNWSAPLHLRGALPRAGAAQRSGAQGPDERADGSHRGGADDLVCLRRSAVCATGTTATRGCATRRSSSTR